MVTVWAPSARAVEMVTEEGTLPLTRRPDGWWAGPPASGDYRFSVDGGPPRADPRSPHQPHGVAGPTRPVDHAAFAWTDDRWRGRALPGSVIYELHVGTFTPEGTFAGVIERLPHLVELGVDFIELMPVAEFPGQRGWGYDGVLLFAPHHTYGGPDGMKRLVEAAHGAGIGVILDVVYNHLGPAGNHLAEFGPYFTDRHLTPWGDAVNFDGPGSDEVRRFFVDNALMWLRDYHVDGLRLDAVHAIVDTSAVHILEQLADEVDALAAHVGRPLTLIAESDLNDPRLVAARAAGGYGLDAAWADDWHHAVHVRLTGETRGYYRDFDGVDALSRALARAWVHEGQHSEHRWRTHGRPHHSSGDRFVVCTQNHDQVGNRAVGDRPALSSGLARIAAALLLTAPFTPMLFQGQEWDASTPFPYFTDHDDDLGRAVTEGRRGEFASFGWGDILDPQAEATFVAGKLNWAEADDDPVGMLDWYRRLIRLRRRCADLTDPRLEWTAVDDDLATGRLEITRGGTTVVANLGTLEHRFHLRPGVTVLLGSPEVGSTGRVVKIGPEGVAIIGQETT